MKRVALVTGANRGLGLETAKELARLGNEVILTSRQPNTGHAAGDHFHPLDVTNEASIQALAAFIQKKYGRLDILVNNAGILLDRKVAGDAASAFEVDLETIRVTMETNTLAPFRLCQIFIPLMRKNGYGRVVNVSSGMGQLSEMNGGYPAYRLSKTALNAVTRIFSEETKGTNILVNSVCPGWVRTDMGGPGAHRTLEQGADTIVWLATLPDGSPTGGFFRDRKPFAW